GLAVLTGVAILGGLWLVWNRWRAAPSGPSPYVPRTPYLNAGPGVRYVGDAACSRCHAEIAADFHRHPMGRSLASADEASQRERGGETAAKTFEAQGLHYTVERRGGRLIHKEQRLDAQGRLVAGVEAEVRFVLGSGERGLSYLIDRDGRLFQSPI